MRKQCSEDVRAAGAWPRFYKCKKTATVERNGAAYCVMHDPDRVAAKRKEREEEFAKKLAEDRARYRLNSAATDLLRAAKMAEVLIRNGGVVPIKGEAWKALHAAITKAEGRQ